MIKPPCKNCNDRSAGCHSFCKDWRQYEAERNAMYERKRSEFASRPELSKASQRALKERMK